MTLQKEQEKEQEQEQEGTSEWSELSDYAGKVIGSASSSFAPALEMARQAFLTEQITLSDEVVCFSFPFFLLLIVLFFLLSLSLVFLKNK